MCDGKGREVVGLNFSELFNPKPVGEIVVSGVMVVEPEFRPYWNGGLDRFAPFEMIGWRFGGKSENAFHLS